MTWQQAWTKSKTDPLLFATGVLGYALPGMAKAGEDELEPWQADFLKSFFLGPDGKPTDAPRHSVRSGHGIGKTTVIAILALWHLLTRYDGKVVITAATQDQLRDGAWAELRKQLNRLPEAIKQGLSVGEERIAMTAAPEMGFIVRRTASKSNPQALAGIHAKSVLYLPDEASAIEDVIFETAAGSLSTHGAMCAMFSNPTRTDGFFFDSHNKMRDRWRCIKVSSKDVPRARGHIEDIIRAYGEGSNRYRVRVLGEFPTANDDTVIPLELAEAARGRDVALLKTYRPLWGVDVARFGDDRSAIAKRQANKLLEPVKWWSHADTMVTAGRIKAEWDATHEDMRPSEILVDAIGYGAGVCDALKHMNLPARAVNVAESAAVDDEYNRLRDELWFKGRAWFSGRDVSIPATGCEELVSELCTPTYDFSVNGKKVVESKKDMKKRGLRSPDLADAFLNTFASTPLQIKPRRRQEAPFPAWAA